MNTLTDEELTTAVAAGNPVATWPRFPILIPALPTWPGPGVDSGLNPLAFEKEAY